MATVADYKVTFSKLPIFGTWTWRVQTPDGRTLVPYFGLFVEKETAERDALRRIETDLATEHTSGEALKNKYS
jgi:hypothetical protein